MLFVGSNDVAGRVALDKEHVQRTFLVAIGFLEQKLFRVQRNLQLKISAGKRLQGPTVDDNTEAGGFERADGGAMQFSFYNVFAVGAIGERVVSLAVSQMRARRGWISL